MTRKMTPTEARRLAEKLYAGFHELAILREDAEKLRIASDENLRQIIVDAHNSMQHLVGALRTLAAQDSVNVTFRPTRGAGETKKPLTLIR